MKRPNRYALVLEFSPSPEYGAVKPICLPFLGLHSSDNKEDTVVKDVLKDVLDRVVMMEEEEKHEETVQQVVSEIVENVLTNVTKERTNRFDQEVKELEDVLTSAENALEDSRELRNSISSLSPKNRRDTSSGFFSEEKEEEEEEKEEEKTQLLVENEEDLLPTISEEPPPTTSNEIPAQFPSSYKIVLALKPLAPVPAAFSLHAVFTDAKGRCCEGRLRQISVGFQDLFLPLPAIPALRWRARDFLDLKKSSVPTNHTRLTQLLFDPLWNAIGKKTSSNSDNRRGSAGNADAVKLLLLTRDRIRDYIQKCLAPYVVSFSNVKSNEDQEESWYAKRIAHAMTDSKVSVENEDTFQICRVAIFLPPSYHLLFSFRISAYSTVVRIRTDYWQVLSELDKYFDAWIDDSDKVMTL